MPADSCRGRSISVPPFALTLSDTFSQHIRAAVQIHERQLAMTLEREKSVYWLCITENKKGSVPLLGVWQFMK